MTTWQRLLRRLYLLALGSVALAVVASIVVARSSPPPPSPGIVRAALVPLAAALDDPAARTAEVERLKSDAGLALALYDDDAHLVAANTDDPPRFRPPFDARPPPPPPGIDGPRPPLPPPPARDGPRPPRDGPFDRRRPNRAPRADDRPLHAPPPLLPGLLGPGDDHRPPPGVRGLEDAYALGLMAPSGARFVAVVAVPGVHESTKLALLAAAVLVLLGLVSVAFAFTLSRPLAEVARATQAFGDGDVDARADPARAGAFAELAKAFNEMAGRVSSARRAERELLANVSHELRTPLSRIRVALDLAAEGDAGAARESLSDIEQDLGELEQLVGDILTAARLDAVGTTPLRTAPVALASLVEDAAARFRAAHPGHVLVVDIGVIEGAPSLALDAVLVRRALDNFLDNAGKYSDAGSEVRLRAHREGASAVVVVEDHGVGIAPEDLARLFTPFFRAERSRSRKGGGVGLGLVLSKRIIEAHGGTVSVTSDPGRGTTVTVKLSS